MKNKLAIILAVIFSLLCFNGCGKEPTAPIYEESKTKFRTAAWELPPNANTGYGELEHNPDYSTTENWKIMKDCGFDYAYPTKDYTDDHIRTTLTRAKEVGMKVLIRDISSRGLQSLISLGGTYEEMMERINKNEAEIKARYNEFSSYSSFGGIIAYDEPSTDFYQAIAAAQDWFNKNYKGYEFYVNLLPIYATHQQLFGSSSGEALNYPDYVSKFVDEVNPEILSYDHYPIKRDASENPYIMNDFMYNLNVFAKESQKSGVPFYIYLQTMGFFDNLPVTTYREFGWQSYTSLAFGAQGIQCFSYWTQLQEEYLNNVRGGIVERDGTINPQYYAVQEVFNEIKSFENVYMSFKWEGVKTYSASSIINDQFLLVTEQLESLSGVKNVEINNDCTIGQFIGKKNEKGFMVVNSTAPFVPETLKVTMTFEKANYVLICKKGRQLVQKLNNKQLTLEIGSGEGFFVIPL